MRNCAANGGMTRGVLGEIGRVDEWLPLRIDFGGWIVVLVAQPNRGDRAPKVVKVLAFPARNLGVGQRDARQRIASEWNRRPTARDSHDLQNSPELRTKSSGPITPKAGWSIRLSLSTYKDWLRGSDLN